MVVMVVMVMIMWWRGQYKRETLIDVDVDVGEQLLVTINAVLVVQNEYCSC